MGARVQLEDGWAVRETFGDRLRAARVEAGVSQRELAESLGVIRTNVDRWEHGRTPRNVADVAGQVARLLGVSASWLVFGVSRPRPAPAQGSDQVLLRSHPNNDTYHFMPSKRWQATAQGARIAPVRIAA